MKIALIENFLRWRTSRGFGVQSPSAYSFIRYVINERYPYYCYSDLRKEFDSIDNFSRKKYELYFRFTNFWQPRYIYCDDRSCVLDRYIISGCKNVHFVDKYNDTLAFDDHYINIVRCDEKLYDFINSKSNSNCMIVVEGIDKSVVWLELIKLDNVIRSYDLGDIGIMFFDNTKLKEHFRLKY